MVLRVVIYLSLLLPIITACTSVPVPVPVRDLPEASTTKNPAPAERPEPHVKDKLEVKPKQQPSVAVPVRPSPTPIPLSNELKQQSEKSLQSEQWQQAILLAERGLRIDRKEPFFYWVLAMAYQQLADIQQSVEFARQGLLYIYGDGWLKDQLRLLAEQYD